MTNEEQDILDQKEIEKIEADFQAGVGVLVTLRVAAMPWDDPDPRQWDWKELLDRKTVELVEVKEN